MGVSMIYQAIPEQSTLFEHLRSDPKMGILVTWIFPYGNGIFDFEKIDEDERDEILEGIDSEQPFSSRTEVDQVLYELSIELERLKTLYPDLENRRISLEKSQTRIEKELSQALKHKFNNADELIKKLLYGSVALMPEFFDRYSDQIYLVPYSTVKIGAEVLWEIETRNLFVGEGNSDRYDREDFERWKSFYLQTSDHQEAVLVFAA